MTPWTCPFCSLHCDGFQVDVGASLELIGSDCPRARAGLAQFSPTPSDAEPLVDGSAATREHAFDVAASMLAQSRQPLIAGLATDVAGSRAAFRLAEATGAIVDHLHGSSLMHGVRAIQDRGIHYTTLAEIRNRADLIVCIGTNPSERYPEFFRRCGVGDAALEGHATRHVVFVGAPIDPALAGIAHVRADAIAPAVDVYSTLATLNARLAALAIREAAGVPDTLVDDLRNARYAVIVWEPARLDEQGALAAEAINTLVATLNRTTRASSFALGGSDGAYTANHVFTWLSGLPLRTKVRTRELAHEPVCYSTERLLRDASVDAMVWIATLGPRSIPRDAPGRLIVIAHPAMARDPSATARSVVFMPVSTPGIGSAGHLFRLDGGVALPLHALYDDELPTAAEVIDELAARVRARASQPASMPG